MRIGRITAVFVALCLTLGGCQRNGEVEHQAYVLVLGAERADDGQLQLTARIPKIGSSDSSGDSGASGGGEYLTFTVEGADWQHAREALDRVTPRHLNLSHIELLLASRALAAEETFPQLVRQMAKTPHLYTTARFAVCEGSVKAFIDAQETIIGTRLSSEIEAMLTHYADEGYVPDSNFAELYYSANTFYSDPVAIYAGIEDEAEETSAKVIAYAMEDSARPLSSPMRQWYDGAALFRGGVFIEALNAGETRLLSLIRGSTKSFPYDSDALALELTPEGRPRKRVRFENGKATLSVSLRLSALGEVSKEDARRVSDTLKSAAEDLIVRCQRLGVDPFGFAEQAAGHFSTVDKWLDSGWRDLYAGAAVEVSVTVIGQGSK